MATLYEKDAYAWALEQAALLRAGKLDQIDSQNIAEEIESMGKSERRALISQLARLLMYRLKWDHQPERRSRSRQLTIVDAREKSLRLLKDSPSLKSSLEALLDDAYEDARRAAAIETELEIDTFPEQRLYHANELLSPSDDELPEKH